MDKTLKIPPNTKVFIVEDDAFISGLLVKNFENSGATVSTSADGATAKDSIKKIMPNIVMLDVMLPGADGFEILQQLKADDETKKIPVIMLSNLGDKTSIDKAKKYGAAIYLIKATLTVDEIVNEAIKQLKNEAMTRG